MKLIIKYSNLRNENINDFIETIKTFPQPELLVNKSDLIMLLYKLNHESQRNKEIELISANLLQKYFKSMTQNESRGYCEKGKGCLHISHYCDVIKMTVKFPTPTCLDCEKYFEAIDE